MSILNGFIKTKKYRKTPEGYKLQSQWTSSQTVEMDDGSTLEDTTQDLSNKISDTANSIVTYTSEDVADGSATSWTSIPALTSKMTHATFFQKVSQMFKNVRYLYKMLGTTDISKLGDGSVTGALDSLNTKLDGKQSTIKGAALTITDSNLPASRVLVTDTNGKVAASSITSTILGYLSGITSNVQTQINNLINNFVTPAVSKPYSGYLVYEDSYVRKDKTGRVDFFLHATVSAVAGDPFTIAFIPNGFTPNKDYVFIGKDNSDNTFEYILDINNNIKIVVNTSGQYTVFVSGSYIAI